MSIEPKTLVTEDKQKKSFVGRIIRHLEEPDIFFRKNILFYSQTTIDLESLSRALQKPLTSLISFFWERGEEIAKNHSLSESLFLKYCAENKITVSRFPPKTFNKLIEEQISAELLANESSLEWKPKTPVISFMGHIDHGKTTLIDNIAETHIQTKEAGGITQKITVIPVVFQGKKLILLDSPGHRDLIRLRQRGIALTDIVVLVIDSFEGVMKQTEEIINYIKSYSLPVVVFINNKRGDSEKENNVLKVTSQLQERGLVSLEWGGDTIVVSGSAKNTQDTSKLLENILLLANFKTNSNLVVYGVFLDSFIHPRSKFLVNKIIVQGGELRVGDHIFFAGKAVLIKSLLDSEEKVVKSIPYGEVGFISGMGLSVEIGERFIKLKESEYNEFLKAAEGKKLPTSFEKKIPSVLSNGERKNINLFLISESENSLQVLEELIEQKNFSELTLTVIGRNVGSAVPFSKLELAKMTSSVFLSFGIKPNAQLKKYLAENNLVFFENPVIYRILEFLDTEIIPKLSSKKKKKVEKKFGEAQVLVRIDFSRGNIAGCRVIEGNITKSHQVNVIRGNEKVHVGRIKSLQIERKDVKEVRAGQECGIVLERFENFKKGDKLTFFQIVEVEE